ncbi:MAG: hypothetical protein ABJE95_36575, partial [Byssovorax sp.]
ERRQPRGLAVVYRIELFAEFMALLDDPFSHRASALTTAELDEARLRNLVDSWRMRFEGDATGELGKAYVKAYSARRAELHAARRRPTAGAQDATDPRFLSREALGFREEAALVGRQPGAENASLPVSAPPAPAPFAAPTAAPPRVEPSGVFSAPRLPPEAPPPAIAPPPAAPQPVYYAPFASPAIAPPQPAPPGATAQPRLPRPANPLAGTADISDIVARIALPFAHGSGSAPSSAAVPSAGPKAHRVDSGTASMAAFVEGGGLHPPQPGNAALPPPAHLAPPPAPPGRPKRLIRFDPQTGHPLPAPIWVDIPDDPKK